MWDCRTPRSHLSAQSVVQTLQERHTERRPTEAKIAEMMPVKLQKKPEEHEYAFRLSYMSADLQPSRDVNVRGLMVDCGATSHIITDLAKFKSFDESFKAESHCVELADGTRCSGGAERRGDAGVSLMDSRGRALKTTLRGALYIPSCPQDIFSVKAATVSDGTVIFKMDKDVLIHKNGALFWTVLWTPWRKWGREGRWLS
ncbi:uncharacterized protein LOC129182354 [Dunckerocampus dactyliophorus]|uniref:uncharacterized protein LOC129182354 n=1 Tax=Dunckerocampus dactyliophorus TaxID=161453 RepID=UPI002405ACBE|nr:uncharacterized protein LOC129182354 [Dunckerocampus dactyliophorus]